MSSIQCNLSYKLMAEFTFQQLKSQPSSWLPLFLLTLLGLFTFLKHSISVLKWIYVYFFRSSKDLTKYGSWALITAPTDGIGKAFAFQLASKGLHLILVGRNPDKLDTISELIKSKYRSIQTKSVVVDFSMDVDEGVLRIKECIQGLDVGVLINNVGVSYPYARFLHEVDDRLLSDLIKVNIESTTKVTRVVLPEMMKRGKGAVVNIGSGVANLVPSDPLYTVYAATKAYIDKFSRCLYVEYKNSGIDIQCQVPMYIATKMASIRNPSFFVPSADAYAKASLRWIGYEALCTPYWTHSLQGAMTYSLPEFWVDARRFNLSVEIRRRGQLKDSMMKKK